LTDTLILDEGHASYEGTSEAVDAIVESGKSFDVDVHAHDICESAPKLAESSVSSQISRYSFATSLIENDIEHETINSSAITFSGLSVSPRSEYSFMVIPIDSSSSGSPEFFTIIQQMISNAYSFF